MLVHLHGHGSCPLTQSLSCSVSGSCSGRTLPSVLSLAVLGTAALALALGAGVAGNTGRRQFARRLHALPVAACAPSCLLGSAWAGLTAQWRLSDALALEAEQREIRVTGVIAAMPQAFDRGLRFDFDIESASTGAAVPGHVSLSWFGGYGADIEPPPDMHAGSAVMRTDETGAIRFDFDAAGIGIDAYRISHARYWQGR
jgi:Domain of unknown function (DUF4131)